jgi:Bacterial membrane protein YfhO
MQKGTFQKLLPHILAVLIFLIVAAIYCKPVFENKVVQQQDLTLWRGMAQNSFQYKETHGTFPLWTNSMFSGMPAYQVALDPQVPVNPNMFYGLFTLYLPKPISFFFLACICFYFLTQVLRINPYIGIIGGLAYAYATYNPVIVAVGHDTKMQTIAVLPAFIASLLLVYERKYWAGAALTAVFTCLLVTFNHMQIVYYALIIAFFMTVAYLIRWIRERDFKHIALSAAIVIGCGLLGVLSNAVNIFTTYDASKASIRGGSPLADNKGSSSKTGLSDTYALTYSMYKTEPFEMMVPKIYGGSDGLEIPQEDSKAIEALQQMPQQLGQQLQGFVRFYWGGIGGTSGPAYVGAIICFLTLIGFFVLDSKHKWWILAASVLAILMSWGSYFAGFNGFLLKALPMYNKFRAPSMILVIPTFLFCLMAAMTLQKFLNLENKAELWERYKKGLYLTGGVFLVLILLYFSFDYTSEPDKELLRQASAGGGQALDYVHSFLNGLKEDRRSLFFGSIVRSLLFVLPVAALLWYSVKKKLQPAVLLTITGVLAFIDVMAVDVKYLNGDNYQDEAENQAIFTPTPADQQIMQDKSYYRVFDLTKGGVQGAFLGEGAVTAYFHNSIGGYHGAKLSIYQDLIEHQLYNFPNCLPVINMLNTKYIMQPVAQGKDTAILNQGALGAAWFVNDVRFEPTPMAIMNGLTNLQPKDTALVAEADRKKVSFSNQPDPTATIQLVKNDNDDITYTSTSATNRFAVFSEVFYDRGWKAYIDNQEAPIIQTNYVLRGLSVPAGKHAIHFVFHPASYYTGQKIQWVASVLTFLVVIIALFFTYRNRTRNV